jgi:hypothetical protein
VRGDSDAEAGPHAVVEIAALDGDAASVFVDELAGDREDDAGASAVPTPFVLEQQDGGVLLAEDEDCDPGVGTREVVDGVGDEVGGDLAELVRGQGDRDKVRLSFG